MTQLTKITNTQVPPGPFRTITALRRANKASGHYWFSRDTMEFFASKVYPTVYGGYWFVSSEKIDFEDYRRRYHVNRVDEAGRILPRENTIHYSTKTAAIEAAKRAAQEATS